MIDSPLADGIADVLSPKWFKFELTEEIYSTILHLELTEAEKFAKLKKISLNFIVEGNPRSDIIFELYYQVLK